MRKRIILSVAAVFFAVCTLLTGCGEDNSATPDSASGKAEGTAAPASTAAPTTEAPTTLPPTTIHIHEWEDVITTVHHDAETEQVWVVDKPEKVKTVKKTTAVCNICGMKFEYITGAEPDFNLMMQHEGYERQLYQLQRETWMLGGGPKPAYHPKMLETVEYFTETVPEEGHYETKTVKEAYDETLVTGHICKTCGDYKSSRN